ncbi:MAG: hypothetical protein LC808_28165 [Actinobacteria bacterium]|nr:hypothetical protein [Actinomycetota bacterium]
MKRTRSKKSRGMVTRCIVYRNRRYSGNRPQELKIDVRRGERVDNDYAAAMVAVRTGTPLADVTILEIRGAG